MLAADIGAMNGKYDLLKELLTKNIQPIPRPSIKMQLAECKEQAAQAPKKSATKKINQDHDHDGR